uniref:Reverse transcriptase domain-containing protein n=1 Tax=Panagrellus redivivus TaxID=6233 RepID=A0A7E4VY08_PANRE
MEVLLDHHECIDLLLPEKTKNSVAFSSTQMEMPGSVQTTDKPVVLMLAPQQVLTDKDSEEARQKFAELRTSMK